MMNGRAVIGLILAALAAFLLLPVSCQQTPGQPPLASPGAAGSITILHTNDIHSHLDNLPRLATAVAEARHKAGKDNTLLLNAGDAMSGSIYFKLYHGQAVLWFLNYLGYDAMCLGNHEFDEGLDTLSAFVESAGFQIISANIEFPAESTLGATVTPWLIVEKNGQRYGVFGLLTEETTTILGPGAGITISDPVAAARLAVAELEKAGINKIIALTHIGWNEDLKLAAAVGDIDIIVGGHSHTLPESYPAVVDDDGSPTLVVQAGDYARYLGCLNVSFDSAGTVKDWTGSQIIPLDETVAEDPACSIKLAEYRAPVADMLAKVIGSAGVDLDGARDDVRTRETNLGNLVADSMLDKAGLTGTGIAITGGGGIRDSIPAGKITLEQAMAVLPFDNYLVTFDLTGAQIIAALENGVSQVEDVQGRFPQVAGLRFTWDPSAPPGNRVISAEVNKADGYVPVDPRAVYTVVTTNYLAQGGDGYTVFTEGTNYVNLGYVDYEVLAEYITARSPVDPQTGGRISRK
jgi:2',3'-cyclic-nucleotide 2'-phosphodiesterase (5'-nucleotidase family)